MCVSYVQLDMHVHVFRLWEETAVPAENPCEHVENMQTAHRKDRARWWRQIKDLLLWGITVLITMQYAACPKKHDNSTVCQIH